MSEVTTSLKRLFVRVLLKNSQDAGDTLYNTLMAAAVARIENTSGGKVLISTAGNGHTNTFEIPSGFTAVDAAELVSELMDRYDEAKSKLINDDDIDNPTDQQIHDEIMDKLRPVRSVTHDFSGIRTEREEVEA
jgi:hypothetical protein